MTAQSSGWPGAYGVPLNPDANGWHALTFPNGMTGFFPWDGSTKTWWIIDREASAGQLILGILYCGPAKTPAQVAAAEGAAAWEMRDAAIAACGKHRAFAASGGPHTCSSISGALAYGREQYAAVCAQDIAALRIPAPGALERAVAKAVTEALEALLAEQPSLTALRQAIEAVDEAPAIDGQPPTSVIAPIIWRAMLTEAISARRAEVAS